MAGEGAFRRGKAWRSEDRMTTMNDLLAREPEWEVDSGPRVPVFFNPRSNLSGNELDKEDRMPLIPDSADNRHAHRGCEWFYKWKSGLHGDFSSISLLLLLYLLQGIPLGLIASIPLVLQSRHTSYAQQAVFSFAYWPFSLKLFWAPIVDSCYIRRIGRRKSWLVPMQYLIGFVMLLMSHHISYILGDSDSGSDPNVLFLMLIFLPLNFLAATQDIAVDGWALTILSRKNIGYASTCNAVGQTAGFFLGNVVFLSLESADFCNSYLRSVPLPYGFVSLAGFLYFWGWAFLITTTLVFVFKHEVDHSQSSDDTESTDMSAREAYTLLYKIFSLKYVRVLIVILLTGKIAFAATDGITGLKLIEMGIPKDKLASMALFLMPVQVLLPWFIGRYTTSKRPLGIFLSAYPYRIGMGLVFAFLIWWTPSFRLADGSYPVGLFVVWVFAYSLHQITVYCIFVSMMAFYAQISDPKVGGTYMTLLNTVNNMGGNWPVTLVLSVAEKITWKECLQKGSNVLIDYCNTKEMEASCTSAGHSCSVAIDGYYVFVILCSVVGGFWWLFMYERIDRLQYIDKKKWECGNRL